MHGKTVPSQAQSLDARNAPALRTLSLSVLSPETFKQVRVASEEEC